MAGVDQHQSPEAMLERFERVLPRHRLCAVAKPAPTPEPPTFPPAPPFDDGSALVRPTCAATVEPTGRYDLRRAACEACGWKGPLRALTVNAQDDADDHNGDGLDIPAAA